MSRYGLKSLQKSNVQQKDDLKEELTVECSKRDDLNIEKYIECKVEFTDDSSRKRRVEGRHTQTTSTSTLTNHDTNSSNSSPFLEKNDFLSKFYIEDLELSKVFHIFATSKDIHTHSFTTSIHTIECFSNMTRYL